MKKGECFRYAMIGGCLYKEAGYVAYQKQSILCYWFVGHIWLSLVGHKLEVETKLGKLAVIDQVLIFLGQLLQRLQVRVLFSYSCVVEPMSLYIQSLIMKHYLFLQYFSECLLFASQCFRCQWQGATNKRKNKNPRPQRDFPRQEREISCSFKQSGQRGHIEKADPEKWS